MAVGHAQRQVDACLTVRTEDKGLFLHGLYLLSL
jgi:hypothetical protein